MTLPTLPRNKALEQACGFDAVHYGEALAYGQQCRAQALQEAADLCNSEQWHDTQTKSVQFIKTWNEACIDCADAIRRLV